jgi:hypothetical protein
MAQAVSLERIDSPGQLRRFVALPRRLHAGAPGFVSPLDLEQLDRLDRKRNPWFRRAEFAAWMAWRDGKPVGRVSAQVDRLPAAAAGPPAGSFGFFDAEDDDVVAESLLGKAGVAARTARRDGDRPLNPSINTEWRRHRSFEAARDPDAVDAALYRSRSRAVRLPQGPRPARLPPRARPRGRQPAREDARRAPARASLRARSTFPPRHEAAILVICSTTPGTTTPASPSHRR